MDYDTCGIYRRTYYDHGYTITDVAVMHGRLEDVRARLAGTWDNRAGYGTEQAARELESEYRAMLADGQTTIFRPAWYSSQAPSLKASFQHYKHGDAEHCGYCEPRYDIGDKLDEIKAAQPLLRKLEARRDREGKYHRAPETPEELIARFPRAILLERTSDPSNWRSEYYVPGLDLTAPPRARRLRAA